MSEVLLHLMRFAEMIESLFVSCYKTLRFASPLGAATFYLYLLVFIYLVLRCFHKTDSKLFYTIIEESENSSILATLKQKNEEILKSVENLLKLQEKPDDRPSVLLASAKDLKEVEEMYSEFSEEILDSHNSIRDSLILPVMNQLETYLEKSINVITTDGNFYTGVLKGFDQATNLVLAASCLTTWAPLREDVQTDDIVIRGDTVVLVALRGSDQLPDQAEKIESIF